MIKKTVFVCEISGSSKHHLVLPKKLETNKPISLYVSVLSLKGLRLHSHLRFLGVFFYSRFYDFWLESSWIHRWIQTILKNYLWAVLLTFHGKLWHLFTENILLFVDKHYPWIPNSHFSYKLRLSMESVTLFMHRLVLSMDTHSSFSCKVTLSMDNVTLCTSYSSN